MIEILQNFLALIAQALNTIFFVKIELGPSFTVYLGIIIIAVMLFLLLVFFIFEITGINDVLSKLFGGDD